VIEWVVPAFLTPVNCFGYKYSSGFKKTEEKENTELNISKNLNL
jgi:hypothetical protein